jgi:hypothetical protein
MYEINGAFARLPELNGGLGAPFAATSAADAGTPRRVPLPDGVRPNWWNVPFSPPSANNGGGLLGALQGLADAFRRQIGTCMQQLLGTGRGPFFTDASLASTGDPHLSLSGTVQSGGAATPVATAYDDMSSQSNLFSSDAFGDGFTVSTRATAANAQGITYNSNATAWIDGGRDAVSVSADGTVAVSDAGRPVALDPGSSLQLDGGATVSRAADGSVTIAEANLWGGRLDTTFRATGPGVDVTAQAHDVSLDGTLVTHALG